MRDHYPADERCISLPAHKLHTSLQKTDSGSRLYGHARVRRFDRSRRDIERACRDRLLTCLIEREGLFRQRLVFEIEGPAPLVDEILNLLQGAPSAKEIAKAPYPQKFSPGVRTWGDGTHRSLSGGLRCDTSSEFYYRLIDQGGRELDIDFRIERDAIDPHAFQFTAYGLHERIAALVHLVRHLPPPPPVS